MKLPIQKATVKKQSQHQRTSKTGKVYSAGSGSKIKKIKQLAGSYKEFSNVLNGKISIDKFIDIVSNQCSCEPEDSSESKSAKQYAKAVFMVANILYKNKKIDADQKDELLNYMDDILANAHYSDRDRSEYY